MNYVHRLAISFVMAWIVLGAVSSGWGQDDAPEITDEQVADLVEQVTEGTTRERRDASDRLIQLGERAVAPLAVAAETEIKEESARCFDVLTRLAASDNEAIAQSAKESLERLTESSVEAVARRAKTALRLKNLLRQHAPQVNPAAPRRSMRMTSSANGKTIQLERTDEGSFTGKVTETVNGNEQTTPIQIASEKELEEKFPDAYRAYKKQLDAERIAGKGPMPAAGQGPGNLFDAGGQNQRVQINVNNGKRHVQANTNDEQVEITDTNGKDIELKWTRLVDGKSKTDTFTAVDLDDLKKKDPDAAKIYERHAGGKIGGGAIMGIQVQLGGAAGGLPVRPVPIPGLVPVPIPLNTENESLPDEPVVPRRIRVEQPGRKIEITDEDGKNIRVKIIKLVDGKEAAQEFSADDLRTLNIAHPEAAKLYSQFTGRSLD